MDNKQNNSHLKKQIIILIFFILLGLGIYFNSLQNSFHYDDRHHIVQNIYIQNLENIPLFFTEHRMFSVLSGVFIHYRPLVMVSYALNYYFGGLNPAGYHLVNLAFHVGSAFLLFLILEVMLGNSEQLAVSSKQYNLTAYSLAPLVAGLIFLTTPFNSEVVNYITARSSVMCSFFMLLSFYLWVRYREVGGKRLPVKGEKKTEDRLPTTHYLQPYTFYIVSFLAFLFAMLTKEVAIMLPAIFLIYDIHFSKILVRFDYRAILPYLPFGITGIIIGFIIRMTFFRGSSLYSALSIDKKSEGDESISHLIIAVKVIAKYAYSIFMPVGLSIWHDLEKIPDIIFFISLILIAVLLVSAVFLWRRSHHLDKCVSFFVMWFFVTLLPLTLLSLNAPYQENRGHIAAAGLTGAFVTGSTLLMNRAKGGRSLRGIIYVTVSIIIIFYSAGTVVRNKVWLNDLTLWTDVSKKYPYSEVPRVGVGLAHQRSGNIDAAESEYLDILKKDPQNSEALGNLGIIFYNKSELDKSLEFFQKARDSDTFDPTINAYLVKIYKKKGDLPEAARHLLMLIAISPHNIPVYHDLTDVYMKMGRTDELYKMMRNAISEDPDNAGAYRALGLISLRRGDLESAKKAFEKVLSYVKTNQDVLLDLGYIYGKLGMFDKSEYMFRQVIALSPNDAEAMQALADIYQRQGRLDEALSLYQSVMNENPDQFTSFNNLGLLFMSKKNMKAAIESFERSLGQDPGDHMARFNLARAYEITGRKDLARREFESVLNSTSNDERNRKIFEVAQKKLAELQ